MTIANVTEIWREGQATPSIPVMSEALLYGQGYTPLTLLQTWAYTHLLTTLIKSYKINKRRFQLIIYYI